MSYRPWGGERVRHILARKQQQQFLLSLPPARTVKQGDGRGGPTSKSEQEKTRASVNVQFVPDVNRQSALSLGLSCEMMFYLMLLCMSLSR